MDLREFYFLESSDDEVDEVFNDDVEVEERVHEECKLFSII